LFRGEKIILFEKGFFGGILGKKKKKRIIKTRNVFYCVIEVMAG